MSSPNSTVGAPQPPNPLTPMAFLPPDLAFQVTISVYLIVGSMGVITWDILNNLHSDYLMLFRYRVGVPTIVYYFSRIASLTYVLLAALFETAPLRHCKPFEKAVNVLFPLAVCSTALLFFFRVRAVFNRNKWVVTFFTFMWLAVVAGCLSPISGVAGMNIGPTKYCIIASVQPYIATAAIIPLVNDTLVFLAISWRLMQNAHVDQNIKTGFRIFAFGEYMPGLSRALLQDGQAYYLTIVTTSLLTVIMLYVDAVPVVYRTMFTVPNIVLMNVMACRVFRHTKFGLLRECEISTSSLLKSKAGRPKTLPATQVSVPLSALRFQTGPGFTDTRQGLETQVVDGTTTGGSQGDVSPDGTEVKYSPYCGDRIV